MQIKKLTRQQLKEFFTAYRSAFPDWSVEDEVVLARREGPLTQRIAFEALRDGAYRPSCSVEVGDARILFRFLDIRHREVLPRQHTRLWPEVVRAREEQFQPHVRKPLDVREVLRLGEEEAERDRITNVKHNYALALLSAHVGEAQRALFWCVRIEDALESRRGQLAEWEQEVADQVRKLRER